MSVKRQKDAKNLFLDDPTADLVVRTSDKIDFRVHKLILAHASPIFSSILSLPHPPPEYAADEDYIDGLPILCVTEHSHTMYVFLRCCYPTHVRDVSSPSAAQDLFQAGKKYEADIVLNHASKSLLRLCGDENYCVQAYVIACHLGRYEEAKVAAKTSLSLTEHDIAHLRFKQLELITAATFLDLLDYHEKCRAAAVSLLSSPDCWINCDEDFAPMFEHHSRSKKCCAETNIMYFGTTTTIDNDGWPVVSKRGVPYRMKMWAAEYLEQLGAFAGDCKNPLLPIRALVSNPDAAARAVKSASECPNCREQVVQCILQFTQVAETAVDETISSISLKTDI